MKKALMPIVIILAIVALLTVLGWWYEQKYGTSGPFRGGHGHGDEEEVIQPPKAAK